MGARLRVRRLRAARARTGTDDSRDGGFTLTEVVIAMAVFVVLAGSVLGILVETARTSGDNLRRTTATNLASREIEAVRNLSLNAASDPLPEGSTTSTTTVGNISYTILRTVTVADATSSDSICASTGGSTVAYKLVTVKVSWANMGTAKPIRADTLRAIGVGEDSTITGGTVALTVTGADGVLAGIPVTLTSSSQTLTRSSGDDGCVVFTDLDDSTYTASVSSAGHVGTANTQAVSQTVTSVSSDAVVRATLLYSSPRSVSVTFAGPAGSTPVTGIPVRAGGTYVTGATALPSCTAAPAAACASASPGTLSNLYPDTYTVSAGACTESTPSSAAIALTGAAPASTPALTVPLGAITVKVQTLAGIQIISRGVTISHAVQGSGCTAGESYTASSVSGGQTLALPYGTWTVATTSIVSGVSSPITATVTVSPSSPTATATLVVVA